MTERDLLDVLDRKAARFGTRPVLEILVDWITQGFRESVLEAVEDALPDGLPPADPGRDPEDGGTAGPVWVEWQRPFAQ